MIVVMGAAGNVGGKVADRLLREDQQVRVLEHRRRLDGLARRGAEVVTGDAANPDDLGKLFDGAEAALVLLPEDLADRDFTANRSRMSAAIADAIGPPTGLRELERRLAGLERTGVLVLRSGFYMENLLAALPMVQAQHLNGSAIDPDLPIPMIATRDVAGAAAARLLRRDVTGHQVKLLLGPEDVTMAAAIRAIGDRLGLPDLPYVRFPPEGVRAALAGAGMSGEEGYDEARRIWNGAIDRHPALIARCAGADDVATAVRFACERDLAVSVRGGGHAVAGHAVSTGA